MKLSLSIIMKELTRYNIKKYKIKYQKPTKQTNCKPVTSKTNHLKKSKMKNIYLLLFPFFICTLVACKKEPTPEPSCPAPCYPIHDVEGLPPVSITGEETLGFLLDGEPWVAQGSRPRGTFSKLEVAYNENTGFIEIVANRIIESEDINQYFLISSYQGVFEEGFTYRIESDLGRLRDFNDVVCNEVYKLTDEDYNRIEIVKLQKDKNLISCKFQMKFFIEENCQDTITISNGRVDAQYIPY